MKTDYLTFSAILIGCFTLLEAWMRHYWKRTGLHNRKQDAAPAHIMGTLPFAMVLMIAVIIVAGWFFAEIAERNEKVRLKKIVRGIAPTLAYELNTMGHGRITGTTAPDDPHYLSLIATMVHWMKLNPEIESIYTMRKLPDNSVIFILGPETDYDRNGVIEGEREARVPIGEKYDEVVPEMEQAFRGEEGFQDSATNDKWGYAISAFVPIYDTSGKQEAILGVDFNGASWQQGVRVARLHVMGVLSLVFVMAMATYLILFRYRVEEARIKRHQAELARSKDEAEKANRAKSEFLSRMSHELRTPLNAILGFGQLLGDDASDQLSKEHKRMVHEILLAGNHLLELINEILDLSRIETGRMSLSFETVPVKSIIASCLNLIQPMAQKRNIVLTDQLAGCEGWVVTVDPTRLQEVLLNLMSNAVKYNREAGSVTVSCERTAQKMIRIGIADTGPGISEAEQKKIFEPFTRLSMHSTIAEGTGIGLTIAKRLIELMGGSIGVRSAVNEGSYFWVDLPLIEKEPGDYTEEAPLTVCEYPELAERKRTILYIEDNPANLLLVAKIFSRYPTVTFLSAPYGMRGVELAQKQRIDIILLDISLPDIDGYEVLKRLRELETTRDIPVVAVSSNAMPEDIERGKAAGFTAFLTKPINVHNFIETVHAVLAAPSRSER